MEQAFENLKKEGNNDVDNLVKWMKDSKVIESTKDAETKARQLFKDCDIHNVQMEKFREALDKLAKEQRKSIHDLTKTLSEHGPKILDAFAASANAFKKAMEK